MFRQSRREIEIAMQLRHRNVVRYFGAGKVGSVARWSRPRSILIVFSNETSPPSSYKSINKYDKNKNVSLLSLRVDRLCKLPTF